MAMSVCCPYLVLQRPSEQSVTVEGTHDDDCSGSQVAAESESEFVVE